MDVGAARSGAMVFRQFRCALLPQGKPKCVVGIPRRSWEYDIADDFNQRLSRISQEFKTDPLVVHGSEGNDGGG